MADQYRDITSDRTLEATLGWTKNIFYGGGLSWSFVYVIEKMAIGTLKYTLVCFTGAVITLLWYFIASRVRTMMSNWNNKLAEIEKKHPTQYVPVFSSPEFMALEDKRMTGGKILMRLIAIFTLSWFIFSVYSLGILTR